MIEVIDFDTNQTKYGKMTTVSKILSLLSYSLSEKFSSNWNLLTLIFDKVLTKINAMGFNHSNKLCIWAC